MSVVNKSWNILSSVLGMTKQALGVLVPFDKITLIDVSHTSHGSVSISMPLIMVM